MTDELMTPDEICARLKVKRSWLYNNPGIPHVKVGRYNRYRWTDVLEYLNSRPSVRLGIQTKHVVMRHSIETGEIRETPAQVERMTWFDSLVGIGKNANQT